MPQPPSPPWRFEALSAQRRWTDALHAFDERRHCFGAVGMHPDIVSDLVHNTGMHCAVHILTVANEFDAITLLTAFDHLAPAHAARLHLSDGYRARLQPLEAINATANGDNTAARVFTSRVPPTSLIDYSSQDPAGRFIRWQMLRSRRRRNLIPHGSWRLRCHRKRYQQRRSRYALNRLITPWSHSATHQVL